MKLPYFPSLSQTSLLLSLSGSAVLTLGLIMIHTPMWIKGHSLGWDAMNESWGDLSYAIQALQAGHIPFWNHLERGGYPFIADPQTAVFYPVNWLIYISGMLFGLGPWLSVFRSLLHYFIGALGCHLLALRWKASVSLSLLFSSLYIYSGRLLKSKDNAGLWTMVWLPWLMWSLDKLLAQPNYKSARNLSLILTLAFYAGYPPNLARSLIFLLFWSVYKTIQIYRNQSDVDTEISDFPNYLVALVRAITQSVVITLLLCAPGIMSTLQVLSESERGQLSLAQLLMSRFQLLDILDILSPRLIHSQSYALTYVGLVGASLALIFVSTSYISKVERSFFVGILLITLLWTCGQNVYFLEYFIKYVPSFSLWRIAEQYAFLSVFSISIMALKTGLIIEKYSQSQAVSLLKQLKWTTFGLGLVFLVSLTISLLWSHHSFMSMIYSLGITSCIFLLTLCSKLPWFNLSRFWLILCLISWADIALQQQDLVKISQAYPKPRRDHLVNKTQSFQRFVDHHSLRWRPASRLRRADLNGRYSTMVNRRWHRYMKAAQKGKNLYAWGGVSQIFQRGHRPQSIMNPAPYAFWTKQAEYIDHDSKLIQSMSKRSPQQALRVFLGQDSSLSYLPSKEDKLQARTSHALKGQQVKVQKAAWGQISIELDIPQNGYLVVNESYSPWWRVQVDDGPWQITHRANYIFQAIYLTRGHHKVKLNYSETPTLIALGISLLTILLMVTAQLKWWPKSVTKINSEKVHA